MGESRKKRTTRYPTTKFVLLNASFLTFAALTAFISTRGLPGGTATAAPQRDQPAITAGTSAATPQSRSIAPQANPAPARRAARVPVARSRGS